MVKRALVLLIAVVCLAAFLVYSQFRSPPQRVSGIIEADEIRLGSRVGGRVARVHVVEGQLVEKDELLLEFEPYDLLARETEAARFLAAREAEYQRLMKGLRSEEIAQAKAQHDQLEARLHLLEAGPRPQEIDASRARLDSAEAVLKLATQIYERRSELLTKDAINAEEFERTRQEFEAAQAMLIVRQKELELLEMGTRFEEIEEARAAVEGARQAWQMAAKGFRQEELDQAEAARDAAQAALDVVRHQKAELSVKSPITGRIDALDLQPGDLVPANAPVLSMIDDRHLWVRAYFPLNRVAVRNGQTIRMTVDSLPEQEFTGTISFVSRQAEFTPSNVQTPEERSKQVFRVKVALPNARGQLRSGMTTDLWLDTVDETP